MQPIGVCQRCGVKMEEGFVIDTGWGAARHANWKPERPPKEPGLLGRLGVEQESRIKVRTYRCPKCGVLESYAPDEGMAKPGGE